MAYKLTHFSSLDVDVLVSVLNGEESVGDGDARAASPVFLDPSRLHSNLSEKSLRS